MRFIRLPEESAGRGGSDATERSKHTGAGRLSAGTRAELSAEYRAGHRVGVLTLGAEHLFFRRGLTVYVLPYTQISRYFRRVLAVPARIGCCTGGELRIEHLVVCCADGGAERELAQIQLPGERAAKAVMEELRARAPGALSGRPAVSESMPESPGAQAVPTTPVSDTAPQPERI